MLTESILDDVFRAVTDDWQPASEIIRSLRDSSNMSHALTELVSQRKIVRRLPEGGIVYEYRRAEARSGPCLCDSCRMLRRRTDARQAGKGVFVEFETLEEADSMALLIGGGAGHG